MLVVDQGRLVGIFTERDVVTRVVAQEIDVDHVQMQEVMHPHPDSLGMEDELVYALHQMSLGEYRPLPVVDDQRRPIALVSMQDIIGYLLAFFPQEGFNFPPSPAHRIAPTRDGVSTEGDSPGSASWCPTGRSQPSAPEPGRENLPRAWTIVIFYNLRKIERTRSSTLHVTPLQWSHE